MQPLSNFAFKQKKYMPVFPKATGKHTAYIEGYPYEDDEPMSATGYHADQISILGEQLLRYFAIHPHIYVGIDNFIYYREGDMRKCVAPDIYIVLGVDKYPQRRSFYTWSEGAVPAVVFEFLSDATARHDRGEKARLYLMDIGVQEYFIHQPELKKSAEFRGWRRSPSGHIVEIAPDDQGSLFSETLNLYFRWTAQPLRHVRFLRPYLPDGTPITTSIEEARLRVAAETRAEEEAELRAAAETRVEEEAERRQALEAELERLRAQLANHE